MYIYSGCMSLHINIGSITVAGVLFLVLAHIQLNDVNGDPFVVGSLVVAKPDFNVVVDGLIKGLEEPGHLGILATAFFDAKAVFSVPQWVAGVECRLPHSTGNRRLTVVVIAYVLDEE